FVGIHHNGGAHHLAPHRIWHTCDQGGTHSRVLVEYPLNFFGVNGISPSFDGIGDPGNQSDISIRIYPRVVLRAEP
ncbi:hypothetical protein OJ604_11890, partial [Streptococcus anginosus]|nr:hypothetical protein [Streptococcus anginosus]